MNKQIEIEGQKIMLVPFHEKNITDEYISWLKDESVNKYLVKPRNDIDKNEASEYCRHLINSKDNMFFAIIMKSDSSHIGNVRLGPIDYMSKTAKFSMMIGNKKYQNQGLGTEVVRIIVEYCFKFLDIHKIFLEVIPDNQAAVKIYEKNAFVVEGTLRDHLWLNNRHYDLLIMSIIKKQ